MPKLSLLGVIKLPTLTILMVPQDALLGGLNVHRIISWMGVDLLPAKMNLTHPTPLTAVWMVVQAFIMKMNPLIKSLLSRGIRMTLVQDRSW